MTVSVSFSELQNAAAREGLSVLGVAGAESLALHQSRLKEWQERGYGAGMDYMGYPPERYAQPGALLAGLRSIVSFAVSYAASPTPERREGQGRIARYAWGMDYHLVLPQKIAAAVGRVAPNLKSGADFRVITDAAPLLERAIGESAGLGEFGKNTLLIRPGAGSFFFLAELLSELEISGVPQAARGSPICGRCAECLAGCPTGALVGPHELAGGRCISYLTIEKRGALALEERRQLGEWVFGCDICQELCPFNSGRRRARDVLPEFLPERGAGPLLDLAAALSIRTNREFESRFANTPLLRARRTGLLRNACAVAANTKAFSVLPAIGDAVERDASEVVRQHALWALVTLERQRGELRESLLRDIMSRALQDPGPLVREEARSLLES